MNRNSATYGMSWKERIEYRAKRSAQIAAEKEKASNAINRLAVMITTIEEAFKPEADKLHAAVVKIWATAYKVVIKNGKTRNAVRTFMTGFDFELNPIPMFVGDMYIYKNHKREISPVYISYTEKYQNEFSAQRRFNASTECEIINRKLLNYFDLMAHAIEQADQVVADNKAKLLAGVAKYMQSYQTVEVLNSDVKIGVKGFQGEFELNTDKGRRLFTCKAITAEGPVVSFHWRYIIHVKDIN